MLKKGDRYDTRGVSSQKEDVHKAIRHLDKGLYPHAFCKILPDILAGSEEHVTIMHADGAGTKSSLAYVWWKLTGDVSVWKNIAQDAVVMNVDDLICVGAFGPMVFSSSIGRNKKYIPGEVISALIEGTQEVLDELTALGIPCYLSGGETADVGDLVRTVIVDSTVVCRMKKQDVLDTQQIRPGMVIVGLCSYGKTTYEKEYNGGMGSNGLTAARHDLFHSDLKKKFPESFDATIDPWAYTGSFSPEELLEVKYRDMHGSEKMENIPLAKLVLSPTRTYAPVLKDFVKERREKIGAIIHCSGGGQTKVLHFLKKPMRIIKDNLFNPGPVFNRLADIYGRDNPELFRNFNMGHRMEVYLEENAAGELIRHCGNFNLDAQIIGRVEHSANPELHIHAFGQSFAFNPSV